MNGYRKVSTKYWILFLSVLLMAALLQKMTPAGNTYAAVKTGYAKVSDLNMRKKPSSSSRIIKKFKQNNSMQILSQKGSWYKIKSSGKTGYVYKKYVSFSKVKKTTGNDIVKYAKKFVGNPYRWGGTSLTRGADCSGFTQSVYKHFDIKIPRTSSSQRRAGKKVSNLKKAQAGDLICYYGHVAIYMGKNKIIHASSRKTGIKISHNAKYRKIASIRRLV